MKSSTLRSIIESEMFVGSSEMIQRFQKLRGSNLLPADKGQASRDLTKDEIINGILSVMDNRPGFSVLIVLCAKKLKPVRGIRYSYQETKTFGEALQLILENPEDLVELRVKGIENEDRGVEPYARGSMAQMICKINGKEKIYYYDPRENSLSGENSEDAINYDPKNFKSPFEREYVLKNDIFRRIADYLHQENQRDEIMKKLSKQ